MSYLKAFYKKYYHLFLVQIEQWEMLIFVCLYKEIITHARKELLSYTCPRHIVFGELRERAQEV